MPTDQTPATMWILRDKRTVRFSLPPLSVSSCAVPIQAHPCYREGFEDALDGEPLPIDAADEYAEGWLAAHECNAIVAALDKGKTTWDQGATRRECEAWKAPA